MPTQTTGRITYAGWDERPLGPAEGSPRLAHAAVTNTFTGGITATDTICEYTVGYVTEKTGVFTGLQLLTGELDGHDGTFVVQEHGSFEPDGTVRGHFEVVPGSGTGALTGLRGTGTYTCRPGDTSFPYTFGYDLG